MPTLSGPSDEEFEAALAAAHAAQEALREAQAREAQGEKEVTQLHHSLLTLSGVPKAKWQSLPVLDVVKVRPLCDVLLLSPLLCLPLSLL